MTKKEEILTRLKVNKKIYDYSTLLKIMTQKSVRNAYFVHVLNQHLGVDFHLYDSEIPFSNPQKIETIVQEEANVTQLFPMEKRTIHKIIYPVFSYPDEKNKVTFFLMSNYCRQQYKIAELKHYSFLLLLKRNSPGEEQQTGKIIADLKELNVILSVEPISLSYFHEKEGVLF